MYSVHACTAVKNKLYTIALLAAANNQHGGHDTVNTTIVQEAHILCCRICTLRNVHIYTTSMRVVRHHSSVMTAVWHLYRVLCVFVAKLCLKTALRPLALQHIYGNTTLDSARF
jgi:hypothetical protein